MHLDFLRAMKTKIYVCTKGKHCKANGAKKIFNHLKIQEDLLAGKCQLEVKKSDCLGFCKHAPAISVRPLDKIFKCVDIKTCNEIIAKISNYR